MNVLKLFRLARKWALARGHLGSIGRSVAETGACIIGVPANLALNGSDVKKEVGASGCSFKACQCNLGNTKSLLYFTTPLLRENKQIAILVNYVAGDYLYDTIVTVDAGWMGR